MTLSPTMSTYLARRYMVAVGMVFLVFVTIAFTIDMVELLRRASGRPNVTFFLVTEMALLKLPDLIQKMLPFTALFGIMLALSRLTRTNELAVTRAAGISVWQFLAPALIIALLSGAFVVAIFNPLSSALASRYEQMESKFLRGRTSAFSVSPTGLWLRDTDPSGQVVVHALRVAQQGVDLSDAILLFYEGTDRFVRRIDAGRAQLRDGHWDLDDVLVTGPDQAAEHFDHLAVATTLTLNQIQDSFASPETMSFWALPGFINTLELAGFNATRHRLYWHATLAGPFLLAAMVLVAAVFSLRMTRGGGVGITLGGGAMVGFLLFFLSDLTRALGKVGTIPVPLAAWVPVIATMALAAAALFTLEDG